MGEEKAAPCVCAQELLDDQTLVDTLLNLVPRGVANARRFSAEDMHRLEVRMPSISTQLCHETRMYP